MSDISLDELRAWVQECGDYAKSLFNNVTGRRKADRSWVTEADETVERILTERLTARYPEYGILGEEQARLGLDREFVWALDPVDGTASFIAGLPIWCISLGLLRRGQPHMGLLYFPLMDDWYWAEPEGAAYLNGQPIQVAPASAWESEDWIAVPSNIHRRFDIDFVGKSRSLGSTAASICYTARGSASAGLISASSIWDIAAALAVLHAAGGVAVGLSGDALVTVPMLDGRRQREPALVGHPANVEALRPHIRARPRQ
jgi:myo-inositol-1(or 4)-monophosphatase